ncbi:MAG: citramalate synthase [Firmicutes bacterium]|nr:citramalate synthase [Bacillota bacterium]
MAKVEIYDTTLRDGAQGEGISFSVEDKLKIARRLDQMGFDYIEGGWPGSNPKDNEFFQRARKIKWQHAKLAAFGSTRRAGTKASEDANLQTILDAGVKVAAIVGKSWDFHVTNALQTTLAENLAMVSDSIAFLSAHGLEVVFDAEHFFDGYKANPAYALKVLETAAKAGARVVVLCDTNGGTLPWEIEVATQAAVKAVDVRVGVHIHNDAGLAVANSLVAINAGATHVQGTVNGYGERCGNADLCSVIPNLQLKAHKECLSKANLEQLTRLSNYVSELANQIPNDKQPFVGKSVFSHKGGLHVSALMKHPETYEHIEPELVGNRRRVLISELSGASNIAYKAKEYDIDLEHGSPALRSVVEVIKDLEYQGYHFEGAEASFEIMLKKSLGLYTPFFDLEGLRVIIEKRQGEAEPITEATVKVQVGDLTSHTVAEGNGPVNALDNALRKALEEAYPQVQNIRLTDYKVRVLNERRGTEAKVRVLIESTDGVQTWGTVGVSTNLIEASWRALVDSIEYGLMRMPVIAS